MGGCKDSEQPSNECLNCQIARLTKERDEQIKSVGICDHCGAHTKVRSACDPFMEEVRDVITAETLWCDECYRDRREDI